MAKGIERHPKLDDLRRKMDSTAREFMQYAEDEDKQAYLELKGEVKDQIFKDDLRPAYLEERLHKMQDILKKGIEGSNLSETAKAEKTEELDKAFDDVHKKLEEDINLSPDQLLRQELNKLLRERETKRGGEGLGVESTQENPDQKAKPFAKLPLHGGLQASFDGDHVTVKQRQSFSKLAQFVRGDSSLARRMKGENPDIEQDIAQQTVKLYRATHGDPLPGGIDNEKNNVTVDGLTKENMDSLKKRQDDIWNKPYAKGAGPFEVIADIILRAWESSQISDERKQIEEMAKEFHAAGYNVKGMEHLDKSVIDKAEVMRHDRELQKSDDLKSTQRLSGGEQTSDVQFGPKTKEEAAREGVTITPDKPTDTTTPDATQQTNTSTTLTPTPNNT